MDPLGVIEMSNKERDRLCILRQVQQKKIKGVEAAKLLNISDRQVRNLLRKLEKQGDMGICSKARKKPSNRRYPESFKNRVLEILSGKLEGFGPTFAREKLEELYLITLSKESLRKWMIERGLWTATKTKRKLHKLRERRACFGELIQADGSHHEWFGKGMGFYNLTVFIDDATSKLTSLYFSEEETLLAYFTTLKQHIETYGRPLGLYTDHSAICEVRQGDSITQFHKALNELEIELILAHTAQAKGRVERANQTLQDRLVKELRLREITSVEEANKILPQFIEKYNEKFSKEPKCSVDAHRPLEGFDLTVVLKPSEKRTLDSGGIFQYKKQFYEVQGLAETRNHKGRKATLRINEDDTFRTFVDGIEKQVIHRPNLAKPLKPRCLTRKSVVSIQLKDRKPAKNHPWRRRAI